MAESKVPIALLWCDLETDRLIPRMKDQILDLRPLNIMEVGFIITDMDLRPIVGYREVVKMNKAIHDGLKANPDVLEMHRASGLIEASLKATATIEEIEAEVVKMIEEQTAISPGELQIAGSGVARFDQTILEAKMPQVFRYLHYAPADVGVMRRFAKMLAREDVVNIPRSYKEGVKQHRAYEDTQAHLEEAQRFQQFFQLAVEMGVHRSLPAPAPNIE